MALYDDVIYLFDKHRHDEIYYVLCKRIRNAKNSDYGTSRTRYGIM